MAQHDDCLKCQNCGSGNIKMDHDNGHSCDSCGQDVFGSISIPIGQFPFKLSDVLNKDTEYFMGDLPEPFPEEYKEDPDYYDKERNEHNDYYSRTLATAKFNKITKIYGYDESFGFSGNPCDLFYEVVIDYIDKDKDGLESRLSMTIGVNKDGTKSQVFES